MLGRRRLSRHLRCWRQPLALACALLLMAGCERLMLPEKATLEVTVPLTTFAQNLALNDLHGATLRVSRSGTVLAFDANGQLLKGAVGEPLLLTAERSTIQLTLPPGRYDLEVSVTDTSGNALGVSWATVQLRRDTRRTIPLFTRVGGVELSAPKEVEPNEVFEVVAHVFPPGRPELRVPEQDYTITWEVVETDALLFLHSVTTAKIKAKCEDVFTQATVTEKATGQKTQAKKPTPIARVCPVTVETDLIPPQLSISSPLEGSVHRVGRRLDLTGVTSDLQSGVARVEVYEGVVFLGVANLGGGKGERGWKFSFRPQERRAYVLTVIAFDQVGNEAIARVTIQVGG